MESKHNRTTDLDKDGALECDAEAIEQVALWLSSAEAHSLSHHLPEDVTNGGLPTPLLP